MKLFLSPHQDDESLFGAYTLMRERPFVLFCTYPVIQAKKGLEATTIQRLEESHNAMEILGLNYDTILSITDDGPTEEGLTTALEKYQSTYSDVYAPAVEGFALQHDLVSRVADKLWPGHATHYMTYTSSDLHTKGSVVLTPTREEMDIKNKMLDCYKTQLRYNLPHFEAVRNLPEYYE